MDYGEFLVGLGEGGRGGGVVVGLRFHFLRYYFVLMSL